MPFVSGFRKEPVHTNQFKILSFLQKSLFVSRIKSFDAGIPRLFVDIKSITDESTAYCCVPSQKKFIDSK